MIYPKNFFSIDDIYDNVASIYIELQFSFLKMHKNFCALVLDFFLLPGNFFESKTVIASATEVIFAPGGEWKFTFKCVFSKSVSI